MKNRAAGLSAAIFGLATAAFLTWFLAYRFVLSNDEGIFLEGALRILRGQVPYRDFFLLMGPGTFWLQALALRTLGITLAASRAVTILDISVLGGCIVWLIARRAHAAVALWFGWLFVVFETADPVVALPNHRWDSAAFAMLATTLLAAEPSRGKWKWTLALFAGACAACAAWITPTTALIGVALIVWMAIEERTRVVPFCAGALAVTFLCAGFLAAQHALVPMIQQMLWTGRNYGAANHMMYGSRFGGYAALFTDAGTAELFGRGFIVLVLTLPAIVPPLALIFAWPERHDRLTRLLAIAGIAFLASTYPRMDVPHLAYAAPIFYVLLAWRASGLKLRAIANASLVSVSLLATIFLWYGISTRTNQVVLQTRVGKIRASGDDVALIQQVNRFIPQGSQFFCFPYLPISYFLTLAENPTRYSYLQPGMMSDEDEASALEELNRNPPGRILYQDLTEAQILNIWPGTNPARLRLRKIEDYLATRYRVYASVPYNGGVFQILERREADASSGAEQAAVTSQ
jgi:hypothetical protein